MADRTPHECRRGASVAAPRALVSLRLAIQVDGAFYLFFGGIWGGQLQRWGSGGGSYNASAHCTTDKERPDAPALLPRFARLSDDLLSLAHSPREVSIAVGYPIHPSRLLARSARHTRAD